MSELRPLTNGQYGDDDARNSAQGTVENNEDPKTNFEPTLNLLQDSTQQLPTSPIIPSPSPPSVSADPQGGHNHPSSLHSTLGATLNDEGLTVQLMTELEKEKKLRAKAESELAAERLVKEAALKEKGAALREKGAALREKEAALSEKEAALKREEAALTEKAAVEEERKDFSAVMSQLREEGDTLRKKLRSLDEVGERLRGAKRRA